MVNESKERKGKKGKIQLTTIMGGKEDSSIFNTEDKED
jgi:hypothetical protein